MHGSLFRALATRTTALPSQPHILRSKFTTSTLTPQYRSFTTKNTKFHNHNQQKNNQTVSSLRQFQPLSLFPHSLSRTQPLTTLSRHLTTQSIKYSSKLPLAPTKFRFISPLAPITVSQRFLFGFGRRDRITIPGAKIPISPWKRLRKWLFRLTLLGLFLGGSSIYWLVYLTDHLDQVMRFNIRFRGQGDIHYYATASRVNHKYAPQFTGDKVSDIKLLQAKLIRDIYKIYLATDPLERNQELINRYLGEQKVKALREMAAQDPEIAAELTKEVFLEAQYGLTVSTDVVNAMLQNIFSIYLNTTYSNPTHRHSVDHLHKQFERLKVLEQDLEPMLEFTTACLDALVEGSVATPYQDPKKIPVFEANLTDQNRFGRPV